MRTFFESFYSQILVNDGKENIHTFIDRAKNASRHLLAHMNFIVEPQLLCRKP